MYILERILGSVVFVVIAFGCSQSPSVMLNIKSAVRDDQQIVVEAALINNGSSPIHICVDNGVSEYLFTKQNNTGIIRFSNCFISKDINLNAPIYALFRMLNPGEKYEYVVSVRVDAPERDDPFLERKLLPYPSDPITEIVFEVGYYTNLVQGDHSRISASEKEILVEIFWANENPATVLRAERVILKR